MENLETIPKELLKSFREKLERDFHFVASSRQMKNVKSALEDHVSGKKLISIFGPEGSGRATTARALHIASADWWRTFVEVDVSNMNELDAEKKIFGFKEEHFFTGKEVRAGVVANAELSTICFKNVDKYPKNILDKVLSSAMSGKYQPVGFDEQFNLNARVIFTTERSPEELKKRGLISDEFVKAVERSTIEITELAKRRDDIMPLAEKFVHDCVYHFGLKPKKISKEAEKWLKKAPWRKNAVQLKKAVYSACLQSKGEMLEPRNFALAHDENIEGYKEQQLEELALDSLIEMKLETFFHRLGKFEATHLYDAIMDRVEEPFLKLVMQYSNGNQIRASEMLGINRNTLRTKLKKYEIIVRKQKSS